MQISAIKANSRKTQGIYVIYNKLTNEYYVGMTTTSFYSRWAAHKTKLRAGLHPYIELQIAWDYSPTNIDFIIVELVARGSNEFFMREQNWIDKLSKHHQVYNKLNIDFQKGYIEPRQNTKLMTWEERRVYRKLRRRRDIKPETRLKMFGK